MIEAYTADHPILRWHSMDSNPLLSSDTHTNLKTSHNDLWVDHSIRQQTRLPITSVTSFCCLDQNSDQIIQVTLLEVRNTH